MKSRIPPDSTPLTITLPAYVWRLVKDALIYDRKHAARRSAERARPLPPGGRDLNLFRVEALTQSLNAIDALLPSGEASEVYLNDKHVGFVEIEPGDQWRARAITGSSLGVYQTRAAAEYAVMTQ